MFDRCISFHVTYFPEDARLIVSCLNTPDSTFINVLGVDADSRSFVMAACQGMSEFLSDNHFDFFEVQ